MKKIIEEINKLTKKKERYLIVIDPDYLEELKDRVIQETTITDKTQLTQIAGVDVMKTDLLPEGKRFYILRFVDEFYKNVYQAIWGEEDNNEKIQS